MIVILGACGDGNSSRSKYALQHRHGMWARTATIVALLVINAKRYIDAHLSVPTRTVYSRSLDVMILVELFFRFIQSVSS